MFSRCRFTSQPLSRNRLALACVSVAQPLPDRFTEKIYFMYKFAQKTLIKLEIKLLC